SQTRRGYARGWEAVHFVANVRSYLRLLEWMGGGPGEALRLRVTTEPVLPPPVVAKPARSGDRPATPPGMIR
ncbi:MAG: lytic transglycosylase F, partial [Gammaproteobacteria bacterium]|nr:lytic transglycosylase F [Gammaproteobacteria bacterium]